jgi:ABC-type multidrug transport system ATPase subunit
MSDRALYEARGLELRFGPNLAFGPASFEIREGECLALVGPNGSGKTSLLKALNGLLAPVAGSLAFLGEDVAHSRAMRERSVYLHQHAYIMAGTVAYNVSFGGRARGLPRDQVEARVARAMALLGLEDLGRRRHRALSGGEAQRVSLARAFATGADVLLLDEPSASADSASRELILSALRSLGDATIVFSTHDDGLAAELADRSIRLERGAIVDILERGAPATAGATISHARFAR